LTDKFDQKVCRPINNYRNSQKNSQKNINKNFQKIFYIVYNIYTTMQQSKSLLEKARESARRARARAHRRLMWGGGAEDGVVPMPLDDVAAPVIQRGPRAPRARRAPMDRAMQHAQMVEDRAMQHAQMVEDQAMIDEDDAAMEELPSECPPGCSRTQRAQQAPLDHVMQGVEPAPRFSFFGGGDKGEFDEDEDEDEFDDDDEDEEDEYDQEGGKKNFDLIKEKAAERQALLVKRWGAEKVPKLKTIMNNLRSYVATVTKDGVSRTLGGGKKKRYFHGAPLAAARKVVAVINRKGEMNTIGQGSAVGILLKEVTKGVHKGKNGKDKYTYEYFGWREKLEEPVQNEVTRKSYTTKQGVVKPAVMKTVVREYRNIAIPKRKQATVEGALRAKALVAKKRGPKLALYVKKAQEKRENIMKSSAGLDAPQIKEALKAKRSANAQARKARKEARAAYNKEHGIVPKGRKPRGAVRPGTLTKKQMGKDEFSFF
jgi:hypothetical protein